MIMSAVYTDLHRCFLQHMMNFGCVPYGELENVVCTYAELLNVEIEPVDRIILKVREKIAPQKFDIQTSTCEISGAKMSVFINTVDDNKSKFMVHPLEEPELFERIIVEIMHSYSKSIGTISCLNLSSSMKNHMSKDCIQKALNKWCSRGYLVNTNGKLHLGVRTICEYHQHLTSRFPEQLTQCQLCAEYVYFGRICANCNEVLHAHCLQKYFAHGEICPCCKNPWVGMAERSYEDSVYEPSTSQPPTKHSRFN